jgi:hypothetical protein
MSSSFSLFILVLKIWPNLTNFFKEKLVDFTLENNDEISKIFTISLSKNGEMFSTEKKSAQCS